MFFTHSKRLLPVCIISILVSCVTNTIITGTGGISLKRPEEKGTILKIDKTVQKNKDYFTEINSKVSGIDSSKNTLHKVQNKTSKTNQPFVGELR